MAKRSYAIGVGLVDDMELVIAKVQLLHALMSSESDLLISATTGAQLAFSEIIKDLTEIKELIEEQI
jgi:hypothetical protein